MPVSRRRRGSPTGGVLVTDIDPRHLKFPKSSNLEVRGHNIVTDPLPEASFDLVHSRLVLVHLPERERALERMIAALKPGGWLVDEEFDASVSPDPTVNPEEVLSKTHAAMTRVMASRGVDRSFGRRLFGRLQAHGLKNVTAEGRTFMWQGGSPGASLLRSNYEQLCGAMIEAGYITQQEFDKDVSQLQDPGFVVPSPILWTASGQRPSVWVLAITHASPEQLFLLPTKAGEPRTITNDTIDHFTAAWTPDGKQVVFYGVEPGKGPRLYVQDVENGKPRAISPEGAVASFILVAPDGKLAVGTGPDGNRWLFPISGGEPHPIPGLQLNERISGFSADAKAVFSYNIVGLPCTITRIDLATGKRSVWKVLMPADPAGVDSIGGGAITPDTKSYVYSYPRTLSDLYVVEGLK
jgi:hypothetical protein